MATRTTSPRLTPRLSLHPDKNGNVLHDIELLARARTGTARGRRLPPR
ncbi:MAG: hypothetical protein MZV70_53235 [Desulfobacterales bacterium]|nr:hypothetical protein [Desulfobacterales bacterium]